MIKPEDFKALCALNHQHEINNVILKFRESSYNHCDIIIRYRTRRKIFWFDEHTTLVAYYSKGYFHTYRGYEDLREFIKDALREVGRQAPAIIQHYKDEQRASLEESERRLMEKKKSIVNLFLKQNS